MEMTAETLPVYLLVTLSSSFDYMQWVTHCVFMKGMQINSWISFTIDTWQSFPMDQCSRSGSANSAALWQCCDFQLSARAIPLPAGLPLQLPGSGILNAKCFQCPSSMITMPLLTLYANNLEREVYFMPMDKSHSHTNVLKWVSWEISGSLKDLLGHFNPIFIKVPFLLFVAKERIRCHYKVYENRTFIWQNIWLDDFNRLSPNDLVGSQNLTNTGCALIDLGWFNIVLNAHVAPKSNDPLDCQNH